MKEITLQLNKTDWIKVLLDDKGTGSISSNLAQDDSQRDWNAAVDGVESLVLAQACAGMDIETEQYKKALDSALDGISNNWY